MKNSTYDGFKREKANRPKLPRRLKLPHLILLFPIRGHCVRFGDGVNSLEIYFQKSTNIFAIVQHMSVSFVSLQSLRVHLQNSTVILRNIVEDLCDTAYQKYCNRHVARSLFTLRDPAPFMSYEWHAIRSCSLGQGAIMKYACSLKHLQAHVKDIFLKLVPGSLQKVSFFRNNLDLCSGIDFFMMRVLMLGMKKYKSM